MSTTISTAADANERARADSLLSPRFYTTDFKALERIDVSSVRAEWDATMTEYEGDNNHDHFQRDAAFAEEARAMAAKWDPELRREFLDFLVSSLTSEFSGCVLYKEIQKNVQNPDIKALMRYLARDESRHAGFINQTLRDYGLGVDLGELKRTKAYTYFRPKFILYATYLSEKIGYARYITIFRQLERHPELRFHPIFRWFERWCNDEFRHGESLALIMRADPSLLRGLNLLWIRFFQLAVYATMYVRDHTRPHLKQAMGLDPTEYDYAVFCITDEISCQVFPITPPVDDPRWRAGLDTLVDCANGAARARARGGPLGLALRAWHGLRAGATFARMYLMPSRRHQLPAQVRVRPAW